MQNYEEFRSESDAMEFMSYLMSHNNQGHSQTLYNPVGLTGVEWEFYDVIHEEVRERVFDKINELQND